MNTLHQNTESSVREPLIDESTSYVDQYENITPDNDNPEEETIVNEEEEDTITNDQDNLDQEFLDAVHQDEEEEEIYDDQNNLDKNQNSIAQGDPTADDDTNLDVEDLYEDADDNDLADNDLNDLEGDHLNNPELNREEHNIRNNKDSSKVD